MLAVGPKDATRQLPQELAKVIEMRWSMVTETPQEFLGWSLTTTTRGCIFGVAESSFAESLALGAQWCE